MKRVLCGSLNRVALILSTYRILAKTPKESYMFSCNESMFGIKIGKNETISLWNRFSPNSLFQFSGASAEATWWFYKGTPRPLLRLSLGQRQPCMGAGFSSATDDNENLIDETFLRNGKQLIFKTDFSFPPPKIHFSETK